jgi:hypothetical protein
MFIIAHPVERSAACLFIGHFSWQYSFIFTGFSVIFPYSSRFRFTPDCLHDNNFHPFLSCLKDTMRATLFQQGITILFLAGWCLITTGVGRLFLRSTAIRFASRSEGLFLSAGIGLVITGYAVFLLGVTGSLAASCIALLLTSLALFSVAGWSRTVNIVPVAWSGRSVWDLPATVVLGHPPSCRFSPGIDP